MPFRAALDQLAVMLRRESAYARSSKLALWLGIALLVITILSTGFSIWHLRALAFDDARYDARSISAVLRDQTRRYIQIYDLLLRDIEMRARDEAITTPDQLRDRWWLVAGGWSRHTSSCAGILNCCPERAR